MIDRPTFIEKGRKTRVPLLFGYEVDEDTANVLAQEVLEVSVTPQLRAAMEALLAEARNVSNIKGLNLPVAALRARIAFFLPRLASMHPLLAMAPLRASDKGLVMLSLDGAGYPEDDDTEIESILITALDHWLANELSLFCKNHGGLELMSGVRALLRPSRALTFSRGGPSLLSTSGQLQNASPILSQLAERLVGRELFQGLGPVYRLHTPESRQTNRLDLLTRPVVFQASKATTLYWSACARLEIQTQPFNRAPVLITRPVKVIWQHKVPPFVPGQRSAAGIVFPAAPAASADNVSADAQADTAAGDTNLSHRVEHSALAIRFRRGKKAWELPDEFDHIWMQAGGRAHGVPEIAEVKDVVNLGAGPAGQPWVGMQYNTRFGNRRVPATMLEFDEQQLFEAVGEHAGSLLRGPLKGRSVNVKSRADQGMPRFSPAEVFEAIAKENGASEGMSEQGWMSIAKDYGLAASVERLNDSGATGHTATKNTLMSKPRARQRSLEQQPVNIEALLSHHSEPDSPPPRLVIIADPPYADFIMGVARVVFGDAVNIDIMSLPAGAHGLSETIDGPKKPKTQARFERRVAAWQPHAEAVRSLCPEGAYVLICARKLYRNKKDRLVADDPVNYWAGHHVFPAVARANVHYLLPWDDEGAAQEGSYKAEKQYQDFVYRTHSALMDLMLGHNGHLHKVPEHVDKHFPEWRPRYVLALTQVATKAAAGRAGGVCVQAALRLDLVTGKIACRFGYASRTAPIKCELTDWMPFRKGLVWLASNLSINTAKKWAEQDKITQDFLKAVLQEAGSSGVPYLVTPYGNLLRTRWPWLKDGGLTADNIRLGRAEHLEQAFPNLVFARIRDGESARLRIEVRGQYQQLSPHGNLTPRTVSDTYLTTNKHLICLDPAGQQVEKAADAGSTEHRELRPEPAAGEAGGLPGTRSYIGTMGYPETVQVKRGGSGFRETSRMGDATAIPGYEGDSTLTIESEAGSTETAKVVAKLVDSAVDKDISLPGSLEIVVLNAPSSDDADRIASFLMGLRSGFPQTASWTSLPAPLFYQRRVADYLVGFELAEVDDEDEDFDDAGYEEVVDKPEREVQSQAPEDKSADHAASSSTHPSTESSARSPAKASADPPEAKVRPPSPKSGAYALAPSATSTRSRVGEQQQSVSGASVDLSQVIGASGTLRQSHSKDPALLEDRFDLLWKMSSRRAVEICFERREMELPVFYTREMFDSATQTLARSKRLQSAIIDRIQRHDVQARTDQRYLQGEEANIWSAGLIDLMWARRNELFSPSLIDELLIKKKRSKRMFSMAAYREAQTLLIQQDRLHGVPKAPIAQLMHMVPELGEIGEYELMARLALETFMAGSMGVSNVIFSLLKDHDAEPIDQVWEYAMRAGELMENRSRETSARRHASKTTPGAEMPVVDHPKTLSLSANAPDPDKAPAADARPAESETQTELQEHPQARTQAPSVQEDTEMHQNENQRKKPSSIPDAAESAGPPNGPLEDHTSDHRQVSTSLTPADITKAASQATDANEITERWTRLKAEVEETVGKLAIDQGPIRQVIDDVASKLESMEGLSTDYRGLLANQQALSEALRDLLTAARSWIVGESALSGDHRLAAFAKAEGRPDPEQLDNDRLELAYALASALQTSVELVVGGVTEADNLMSEMRRGGGADLNAIGARLQQVLKQAHERVRLASNICDPLLALDEADPERLVDARQALERHFEQGGQDLSQTKSAPEDIASAVTDQGGRAQAGNTDDSANSSAAPNPTDLERADLERTDSEPTRLETAKPEQARGTQLEADIPEGKESGTDKSASVGLADGQVSGSGSRSDRSSSVHEVVSEEGTADRQEAAQAVQHPEPSPTGRVEAAANIDEEGEGTDRNPHFDDEALMVSTATRLVQEGKASQAAALAEVYKVYHEALLQRGDLGHAPLMVYYAMAYAEYSAQAQITESDDHRTWLEAMSRFEIRDTLQAKAVLAAILRPGFFTPFATAMCTPGLEGRLGTDTPLDLLFRDVQALAQQGCVLRPELLRKAAEEGRESWAETRDEMIGQCHHWAEQEDIHRGFNYSLASKLWIEIMSVKHPVGHALSNINAEDTLEVQSELLDQAIEFLSEDTDDIIKKWMRDKKRMKTIKYGARQQINANFERTLDHLQQLKGHLKDDPEQSSGAQIDRMMGAADKIKGRMEDAVAYLKEGGDGSGIEKAVNVSLLRVLESLLEEYQQPRPLRRHSFSSYLEDAWLHLPLRPEPKTPTRPDWSGCQDAVCEFLVSESAAQEDLVDWHILSNRYFSASLCLKRGLCPDVADAREALSDALTHEREELENLLDNAKDQVQKASLLSIISDARKGEYQGKVRFISETRENLPATDEHLVRLNRLLDPEIDSTDKLLDFDHAQQEIDGLIINPLEQAIETERENFQGVLREEEARLEAQQRPQIEEIRRVVESGGTTALIAAQEMLTFVKSDEPIPANRESSARLNGFTREFLPEVERHLKASEDSDLIGAAIDMLEDDSRDQVFGIPVARADRPAMIRALNAWLALFNRDKDDEARLEAVDYAVSEGLGIKFEKIKPAHHEYKLLSVDLKGYASADVFIMPEFASKAFQTGLMVSIESGVANYDSAVKALNAKEPGFALLHTVLDTNARAKLVENVRREASARIVVDDALVLFSVLNFGERESTLMMVGQAFIKTTPYFTGTPMNMETFYGRREDMRELERFEPKLVYGGRRLGKSSLLAQHCQRNHDPSLLRYCCMVDCQNHSNEKDVLDELRIKLAADGIVSARSSKGTKPKPIREGIIKEMRSWLDGDSERRLDLLLDEADKLIASDAKEDYPLIRSLQVMHQDYRNRFRYVLAGTHNAMRLDQSQNTPLGHMTKPICVRPFAQEDRFDGIRLVTQPLAALGFVFDDPKDEAVSKGRGSWLPFEILATANYFPAVIQILCDSLLEHLYQQTWRGLPPYRITAQHVRDVAESNSVRQKLQDKFKKTFHLDKRYELLAGILANEYYDSRGSDQAMTAEDIRDWCMMLAPNLFPSGAQHIITSYLIELVELSIIVRDEQGRYMLRSPNIAHYMGTGEEVFNIISNMEHEPAPEDVDEKQRRGSLPDADRSFPLTMRQTVGIARSDHRVVVLVGSPANGIDEIKPALDSGFLQVNNIAQTVKPQSGNSSQTLKHVAMRFPRQASKRDSKNYRLASVDYIGQEVAWDMVALSQLARETQGKATNRVVLIVAGPPHAAEILSGSGSAQLDDIPNLDVETLMPWTEETLRLFGLDVGLDHLGNRNKRREIMQQTGGLWPLVEDVARATAVKKEGSEITVREAIDDHPLNKLRVGALLSRFGLSEACEPALSDIAMTQGHIASEGSLEKVLAANPLTEKVKDVRYLEWMGAFQIDGKGQHVLNPWLAGWLERLHA